MMANNILKKAYVGKNLAYRGYYNGEIVWDFGKHINAETIANMLGVAMADIQWPVEVYMFSTELAPGIAQTKTQEPAGIHMFSTIHNHVAGEAFTAVNAGLAQSDIEAFLIASAHPADAHKLVGVVQIKTGVMGNISTYIAYLNGDLNFKMLSLGNVLSAPLMGTYGKIIIETKQVAQIYAEQFCNIFFDMRCRAVETSTPTPQELCNILIKAICKKDGVANWKTQATKKIEFKATQRMDGVVSPGILPTHLVSFMNGNELIYYKAVPTGYDCPDPVYTTEEQVRLLENQKLEPFVKLEGMEQINYLQDITPLLSVQLVLGKTYTIIWDGAVYKLRAKKLQGFGDNFFLGDAYFDDQDQLQIPFIAAPFQLGILTDGTDAACYTIDNESAHVITLFSSEGSIIDPPIKESTPYYHFNFVGWTAEDGGEPDQNILKNITQNTTVFAAYEAIPRIYKITYYDDDEVTILHTEELPYGAVPSYIPKKIGYHFMGWIPTIALVTGNASYVAQWEKITFANGTWTEIAEISEAGLASKFFNIKDTKTFLCNNSTYTAEIAAFDADEDYESGEKVGITCIIQGVYKSTAQYNSKATSTNTDYPWSVSTLRTYCNDTIYNGLEEDLKVVIKNVRKASQTPDYTAEITSEYCWIPNSYEVGFTNIYEKNQGSPYYNNIFSNNEDRKRWNLSNTATVTWHLRSTYNQNLNNLVSTSGTSSGGRQTIARNVVFGFCI